MIDERAQFFGNFASMFLGEINLFLLVCTKHACAALDQNSLNKSIFPTIVHAKLLNNNCIILSDMFRNSMIPCHLSMSGSFIV